MLISLLVKNIAIINEVEVFFNENLNILTGETGAGKSIIIDSVNMAIGGKASKDMIRNGADHALIEIVFETDDQKVYSLMDELGIPIEDGQIIITRKVMPRRSVSRVNGQTVPMAVLSQISDLLIDIHGQFDNQSLLKKSKHIDIVDQFSKDEIIDIKQELEVNYYKYIKIKNEYEQAIEDEDKRIRETSFLEFELKEILDANLEQDEDSKLAKEYKALSNRSTIMEALQFVNEHTGYDSPENIGDTLGRCIQSLTKVAEYDAQIPKFESMLYDIEGILTDFNREIASYISELDINKNDLEDVGKRLDLINHLKSKYGNTIEEIQEYALECEAKLNKYRDYDQYLEGLRSSLVKVESKVKAISRKLSDIRQRKSKELVIRIKQELIELNFIDIRFDMNFEKLDYYTANGYDDAEFIISTNPGEDLKSLSKVASGGELSRIMLGIKSVMADEDDIETLIFDEIDAGISGRTAQMVSEKLSLIAKHHQVICITHLAQITAMADTHYIIEKISDKKTTQTLIRELDEEESLEELARILGGVEITDRVKESAKEMKELAISAKKY